MAGVLISKKEGAEETHPGKARGTGDRVRTEEGQNGVVLPPGPRQGLGPREKARKPSSTEPVQEHSLTG